MKKSTLIMAALLFSLVASTADAGKGGGGGGGGKPGGGGGGVPTNYGCMTLRAGTQVYNSTTTKSLLSSTYACYLCNLTTRVCAIQSPSTLVGWSFTMF